ncbi:hypothetical protein BGZ63DRAFT_389589 [Mariannaea sp. PMI_226]|nr:hypothetical protein BGZ63DRAFT_389589 [Mariannaea sp. PMI_226]
MATSKQPRSMKRTYYMLLAQEVTSWLPKDALDAGVPIDPRLTVLFYAVRRGDTRTLRLLLESGADAEGIRSIHNEDPRSLAIRLQQEDMFWILVEHGNTGGHKKPPATVSRRVGSDKSPINFSTHIQEYLCSWFGENWNTNASVHCTRCSDGFAHPSYEVRERFENAENPVRAILKNADDFSDGFIKRCIICRTGVFLPSSTRWGGQLQGWWAKSITCNSKNYMLKITLQKTLRICLL